MPELPLLEEIFAEISHKYILIVLKARFKRVPPDVEDRLPQIIKEKKLNNLYKQAILCPDIETFCSHLFATRPDRKYPTSWLRPEE